MIHLVDKMSIREHNPNYIKDWEHIRVIFVLRDFFNTSNTKWFLNKLTKIWRIRKIIIDDITFPSNEVPDLWCWDNLIKRINPSINLTWLTKMNILPIKVEKPTSDLEISILNRLDMSNQETQKDSYSLRKRNLKTENISKYYLK